jgi:hypothetical protein
MLAPAATWVIKGALGLEGTIVTRPDGTTQYLDRNGKIIREDSATPVMTMDMAEVPAGKGIKSTIKEFDQNNNVIRETQKYSSANDIQNDTTQFAGSGNPIQAPARGQMAALGQGFDVATANAGGSPQLSKFNRDGFRLVPAANGALPATPASQAGVAGTGGLLGKINWDSLITPAEAASPPARGAPLLTPNFPGQASAFGDQSGSVPGTPSPDAYPLRRVSSAFPA